MAYSPEEIEETFESICKEIEEGSSLIAILRRPDTPGTRLFYEWLHASEEKQKRYARACETRSEILFEDVLNIADDKSQDVLKNEDGAEYLNQEFVQRSKLRIDARKWMLGKMNPKKYGDKTINENHNKNENINIEVTPEEFKNLSSELDTEY